VFIGPAGTGKSTIAAQFITQAASRGERSSIFCFDESPTNLLIRTKGLGIPLQKCVDAGTVQVIGVAPAEFSPGELAARVRAHVDGGDRLIVIDSLNGYMSAMPEERFLAAHLHELLAYLAQKGLATLLTLAQHGFVGENESPIKITNIADTVLLLRSFEVAGEVKQAISVVKKRTGPHERTIRELKLGPEGVHLGEPLRDFQGVLSGTLQFLDAGLTRGEREPSK